MGRNWLGWAALWMLLLLAGGSPLVAQEPPPGDRLELTVAPLYDGNYQPGAWVPLQVTLTNGGATRTVQVVAQPDGSPALQAMTVELTQGETRTLPFYVYLERPTRTLNVRALPETDTDNMAAPLLASARLELRPRLEERLVALVSDTPYTLTLLRRQDVTQYPINAFALDPADLPADVQGYSSLTALLLHDIAALQLDSAQQRALLAWVANGGHLLVGGGAVNRTLFNGLPPTLQPAALGATTDLDTAWFGIFTASEPPTMQTLDGNRLVPATDARVYGGSGVAPLWVWRDIGDGRVTLLAFNPQDPDLAAWAAAPLLWDGLLLPPSPRVLNSGISATADPLRLAGLGQAASSLPPGELPTALPLYGVLVAYLLIVGPVTLYALRRIDRQPLAWGVLLGTAVVAAAVGFWVADSSRGAQRATTHATLIEHVHADVARVRSGQAVLLPAPEQFELPLSATTFAVPLTAAVVSGAQTTAITGASGVYGQQGDPLLLTIPRWQGAGIVTDEIADHAAFAATLTVRADSSTVAVTNPLDVPLTDAFVLAGGQLLVLGDIAPGEQATAAWEPRGERIGLADVVQAADPSVQQGLRTARGLMREGLLRAALDRTQNIVAREPLLLAWVPAHATGVAWEVANATRLEQTLLVVPVATALQGQARVPPALLAPEQVVGRLLCTAGDVLGVNVDGTSDVLAYVAPSSLAALEVDALAVGWAATQTAPPPGLQFELFNWETGEWSPPITFEPTLEPLPITRPDRFVQRGRVLLRASNSDPQAFISGCIALEIDITGSMP